MHDIIIFLFLFITIFGMILNTMGYESNLTLLTPVTFAVGQTLLLIVIGLSNTPIAKGVSLVVWAGWLFLYVFTLNIPVSISAYVYSLILVPSFIGMGLELLEVGKS